MGFAPRYVIEPDLAIFGSRRRPGRLITPGVRFIVVHDTGNPGASATGHAKWYRSDPSPAKPTSAHIFVDDRRIVETIPAMTVIAARAEQALHVLPDRPLDNELYGVDANRAAIGIEYCFGGTIDADEAYARFVWTIGAVCERFVLDPSRDVVGHQILDPARKKDPGQGLRDSGRSYDALLRDVVENYRRDIDPAASRLGARRLAPGAATTTVNLSRRAGPAMTAALTEVLAPGTAVVIAAIIDGETVSGNDDWCRLADDSFVWSGGVRQG